MPLFRAAFYWFLVLLATLLVGFWKTYFSQLAQGELHPAHHFHAVAMLAWVLLLITQAWLIRNRKNARHRTIGKVSFLIAPAVVISGLAVTIYSQANAKEPLDAFTQSIFWFGLFSSILFAWSYLQAIRHRKKMQLHARYMVCTALVFIVPGLSRSVFQYLAPTGIWTPDFFQMTWIPMLIALWLMFLDWRKGQQWRPFLYFNILWAINVWLWVMLPKWAWWNEFSAWTAATFA